MIKSYTLNLFYNFYLPIFNFDLYFILFIYEYISEKIEIIIVYINKIIIKRNIKNLVCVQ